MLKDQQTGLRRPAVFGWSHLLALEPVLDLLHPRSFNVGHDPVRGHLLGSCPALLICIAGGVAVDDSVESELWSTEPGLAQT